MFSFVLNVFVKVYASVYNLKHLDHLLKISCSFFSKFSLNTNLHKKHDRSFPHLTLT